jgi:hypothetical protein
MLKKAVMIDTRDIEYVCPNNENGHHFAMHVSEVLSKKKIPRCPYCKSICKMIDWDKKKKERKETDDDRRRNKKIDEPRATGTKPL